MEVKVYNNVFDNQCSSFEFDTKRPLLEQIEEHLNVNEYKETLVECYDSETGETFYAPIEDEASNSVVIVAGNKVVDESYVPKEQDVVSVFYVPASGENAGKIWGGIIGGVVGVIAAVAMIYTGGATLPIVLEAFSVFAGCLSIGLTVGGMIDSNRKSNSNGLNYDGGKEGKQSPDIRGAENTSILGNNFPFVIGKHLVTPQIVGDPITTYSGRNGEDAYIRTLYCVGYGPLKLTDFKLGEFWLAYNRSHTTASGTLIEKDNVISGMLQGYSSGGIPDNGDILDYWRHNDIQLEIIQQPKEGNVNYGTLYTEACEDQQVNANIFYLADKALDEAAQVVYKGVAFPNKFKTNGVFFTHSCPMEFTVTLDIPQGLYESHTHTSDNSSSTVYNTIPLWICAQWRIHDDTQASSKENGSDYSLWNNIDFVPLTTFTDSLANADMSAHKGNDFGSSDPSYNVATQYEAGVTYYILSGTSYVVANPQPTAETFVEGTYYTKETLLQRVYQDFLGKELVNLQSYGGSVGISQIRISKTITLTKEQCKAILSDNNKGRLIEIRVLRVSPNYINMNSNSGISDNDSPYQYSEHIKVSSIVTKIFDEDALKKDDVLQAVKPLSEKDMRKVCLVALKAKADSSGYLINQLKKLNCVAESFSPYWDIENKVMMPVGVESKKIYYGYFDSEDNWVQRTNDAIERQVTKSEYEQARQMGLNWYEEDCGSNYSDIIKDIVFSSQVSGRYVLTETAAKYNNNTSASGFMLACVGAQNGPIGLGYKEINILSISDWAEKTLAVTDGSTFDYPTVYNGVQYQTGDLIPVRMEANGYIFQGMKLEDLLQQIAFTGRAMWCIDDNGKVKVIMDAPVDYTVGVVNAQNVVSSSNNFSYEKAPAGLLISYNDENDGYAVNQFYCWGDGNSLKNYHGEVEPYSINLVTNPYQMWSLGRYILAYREIGREVLTRKVGPEGVLYNLGDVVLVQSEDLLIGDCSGRIQEIIESNGIIYGFICNSTYEYTGELDTDGNSNQGVTVLQPAHLGKSNAVTIPLSDPRTIVVDGKTYTLKEGTTNLVLFGKVENSSHELAYGVERGRSDSSYSKKIQYDLKPQNICMFGIRNKISAPYRITKIKPERDGCFSETLILYDEQLYQYGAMIPSFQNYVTPPQPEQPLLSMSEVPSTIKELNETNNTIMARVATIYSNHIINLYKESNEQISSAGITSNFIYHFDTNESEWSGPGSNGWSTTQPANPTNQVWVTTATAFGNTTSDTIEPGEWATPIPIGNNGSNGYNTCTISLYKRLSSTPTLLPETVTYHFDDATIASANMNGWSTSVPAVDENNEPCWEIHATALSTSLTDTIDTSKWSAPAKIMSEGMTRQEVIDLIGEVQNESPNVYFSPTSAVFAVDEMGLVQVPQSVDFKVRVVQNGEDIPFEFGEFDLPTGYSASYNNDTLTITASSGVRVEAFELDIPIIFRSYDTNMILVDENDIPFTWVEAEDGYWCGEIDDVSNIPTPSADEWFFWTGTDTQSTEETVKGGTFYHNKYYFYNGTKWEESREVPFGMAVEATELSRYVTRVSLSSVFGGRYLGPFTSTSQIPQDKVIGDFFTWTYGSNVSYPDVQYGVLKPGCCYKWNGTLWVPDNSGKHIAEAMKDILGVDEAKLAQNNSDVIDMVRELIAWNVVTQSIHVTGEAIINSTITAELTIGSNGFIQSANYDQTHGFRIAANGQAVLNEVVVRGDIYANHLYLDETVKIDKSNLQDSDDFVLFGAGKGSGFVLLTSQPSDWTTNWKSYFKKDVTNNTIYKQLTNATAPTFAQGTYYRRDTVQGYYTVSKTGLLEANNAIIYGTIYATDGIFSGKLEGATGTFKGSVQVGNAGGGNYNLSIDTNGKITTRGSADFAGSTHIGGQCGIGVDMNDPDFANFDTIIGGTTKIGGNTTITGVCNVDKLHFARTYSPSATGFSNGDIWMVTL